MYEIILCPYWSFCSFVGIWLLTFCAGMINCTHYTTTYLQTCFGSVLELFNNRSKSTTIGTTVTVNEHAGWSIWVKVEWEVDRCRLSLCFFFLKSFLTNATVSSCMTGAEDILIKPKKQIHFVTLAFFYHTQKLLFKTDFFWTEMQITLIWTNQEFVILLMQDFQDFQVLLVLNFPLMTELQSSSAATNGPTCVCISQRSLVPHLKKSLVPHQNHIFITTCVYVCHVDSPLGKINKLATKSNNPHKIFGKYLQTRFFHSNKSAINDVL